MIKTFPASAHELGDRRQAGAPQSRHYTSRLPLVVAALLAATQLRAAHLLQNRFHQDEASTPPSRALLPQAPAGACCCPTCWSTSRRWRSISTASASRFLAAANLRCACRLCWPALSVSPWFTPSAGACLVSRLGQPPRGSWRCRPSPSSFRLPCS